MINAGRIKKPAIAVCLAAALFLVVTAVLYQQVNSYGLVEDPGRADVAIVLGAAVWPTGPSPALRARVWKGCRLLQDGRADNLIFCGGEGRYPPTEAEAAAVLAESWLVDNERVFLEDRSVNTWENLLFAHEIMAEQGFNNAFIVTDSFHMKRAILMAKKLGIEVLRAPVLPEESYYSFKERFKYTLRECFAIIRYRLADALNSLLSLFTTTPPPWGHFSCIVFTADV